MSSKGIAFKLYREWIDGKKGGLLSKAWNRTGATSGKPEHPINMTFKKIVSALVSEKKKAFKVISHPTLCSIKCLCGC